MRDDGYEYEEAANTPAGDVAGRIYSALHDSFFAVEPVERPEAFLLRVDGRAFRVEAIEQVTSDD